MRKTNLQTPQLNLSDFSDKSLLILDDDDPLRGRLSRAMEKKGFVVREAKTVLEGLEIVKKSPPNFAVVDLRLEDGNGLDVVNELSKSKSDSRIVMLTGYGNLPTAVAVSIFVPFATSFSREDAETNVVPFTSSTICA